MALKLFNTLGRKNEEFISIEPNKVQMYTCGPTVYDYGHIGNFRTFVFQDILRRYLKYKGYKVTQIMNLTDVDDKTIKGAQLEGTSLKKYTERYTKAFFEDLNILNIEQVEQYPKATEHIEVMVKMIKKLIEKGYAYQSGGAVYFDISKFRSYGKLSGKKTKDTNRKSRIKKDEYKDEANDFALWKPWSEDDGDVFWITELGKGRPGWHTECSAIANIYLGTLFDIHSGGIDLIFPHHENEIAQSEAVNDKKFANYWLHAEHLILDGEKMSKSIKNTYRVRDIINKGFSGRTIRYLLSSAHYRTQLNFTDAGLKQAEASLGRIQDFIGRLKSFDEGKDNPEVTKMCQQVEKRFKAEMDNDLNIPGALSVIFDFLREINRLMDMKDVSKSNVNEIYSTMIRLDTVLGLLKTDDENISKKIKDLIDRREEARRSKDWKKSDQIRNELLENGIILEDTLEGVKWKKKI